MTKTYVFLLFYNNTEDMAYIDADDLETALCLLTTHLSCSKFDNEGYEMHACALSEFKYWLLLKITTRGME